MVEKTRTQKGRKIEFQIIPGADHFFETKMDELIAASDAYLMRRLTYSEAEGPYHE
jgi:alpha/beta superfamily hydrolase